MFFPKRNINLSNGRVNLSSAELFDCFFDTYIKSRFDDLKSISSGNGSDCREFHIVKSLTEIGEEEYFVKINKENIVVTVSSKRGALYALSDLKDMAFNGGIFVGEFSNSPACSFRAYRAFLPSRNSLETLFATAEFLIDFKYNTIIIELGGAMEYKRHPAINNAWKSFAAEVHKYSGRSMEIQLGYAWEKNSIHADNAGGDILTQEEVKFIFDKLIDMGFTVIPEVPLLSHTDYICLAYPELAERADDPYPDTYCPSNENTYKVVFDILDEVVSLLNPATINIGHDEYYSMAICDKCKNLAPVDIYVNDIVKIYNYLKQRGIRTMMWADKLLDARRRGEKIGGAGVERINEAGYYVTVPPLYECAKLLPKDILMINWYWEFGSHLDKTFSDNGYEFVYGNLYGTNLDHWKQRLKSGVLGGAVSNWGSFSSEQMQRNLQFYSLASTAFMFWSKDYDSEHSKQLLQRTAKELYLRKNFNIPENQRLIIEHNVKTVRSHIFLYDGVFETLEDNIGSYKVDFENGKTMYFPIIYGLNIGGDDVKIGSYEYIEPLYSTLPIEKKGKIFYQTTYHCPINSKIKSINFIPANSMSPIPEFKLLKP